MDAALLLRILALVVFIIDTFGVVVSRIHLIALGLALLTASFLF